MQGAASATCPPGTPCCLQMSTAPLPNLLWQPADNPPPQIPKLR